MPRNRFLTDDRAAWERAISRAIANDFEQHVRHVRTHSEPEHGSELLYHADSRHDDEVYGTRLYVGTQGVSGTCNCPANFEYGRVCWHLAGAMLLAGHIAAFTCEDCGLTFTDPDDIAVWDETVQCHGCEEAERSRIMAEIYAELDALRATGREAA